MGKYTTRIQSMHTPNPTATCSLERRLTSEIDNPIIFPLNVITLPKQALAPMGLQHASPRCMTIRAVGTSAWFAR